MHFVFNFISSNETKWFSLLSFDYWGENMSWMLLDFNIWHGSDKWWGLLSVLSSKIIKQKVYAFLHLIILPTSLVLNERTACWRETFHKMCVTPSRWKKLKNKIQDRQIRETALNASVSSNIIITVFRRSSSRLLQIK